MAKGKKYTQVNEEEFNRIRVMFDAGLKTGVIVSITERSPHTINNIRKSKTWEQYQQVLADLYEKRKAEREAAKDTQVPDLAEAMKKGDWEKKVAVPSETEVATTAITNKRSLERIATALERLADAWEAQPNKRRLF